MDFIGRIRRWLTPAPPPAATPTPMPTDGLPPWAEWVARDRRLWDRARSRTDGPAVLIPTSVGGFAPGVLVESLLGMALTLRGARVRFLLCDRALPACLQAHVGHTAPDVLEQYQIAGNLCDRCYPRAAEVYGATGLSVTRYSEVLTSADRTEARTEAGRTRLEDIPHHTLDRMAVGEHALAGALRYFARGELAGVPAGEVVLRRYFEAGLLTARAVQRLLRRERFDAAVFHHGIYVPQGLTAEACRREGTRLVTWNVAYRKHCFIFSHDDTYHHTLLDEPVGDWETMAWGPSQEQEVLDYLASRLTGARDWIWFHEKPVEDVEQIAREHGVDFTRPVIGLLTNVFWDAQLHYRANAFANMLDWVVQTIRYFERRPDLQLLIRLHPAEVRGTIPSRQPILDEIRKAFPTLPANVFVIPPQSNSSTYAAMYCCDSVLIYGTKTGVELSSVGIPILVAGEAWIRGKGITQDARTPEEYFRLLDALPAGRRLEGKVLERARKYAYHFFFRRMIPLEFMIPAATHTLFQADLAGLADLLPGRHRGLDVICDGILHRRPFIYPAERLADTIRAA